jgi:hypothetical protein
VQRKCGGGEGVEGCAGTVGANNLNVLQKLMLFTGMCAASCLVDMGCGVGS